MQGGYKNTRRDGRAPSGGDDDDDDHNSNAAMCFVGARARTAVQCYPA